MRSWGGDEEVRESIGKVGETTKGKGDDERGWEVMDKVREAMGKVGEVTRG